jgi:hypothetical protein
MTKKEVDSFPSVLSLLELACKFAHLEEEEIHSDNDEREEPIAAPRREPKPLHITIEKKPQKWTVAMIKSDKIPHRSGVLSHTNFPRIPGSSIYHDSDSYDVFNALRVVKTDYD